MKRLPALDMFLNEKYNNSPAYTNIMARYQNLAGSKAWGAVEFNPETLESHLDRHGKDFGLEASAEYAKAALDFVRHTDGKGRLIDALGVRRYFLLTTGEFASVYPDGTISTYFKPKEGIKYWERQVEKYAKTE